MTTSVETTAAMTAPAEPQHPGDVEPNAPVVAGDPTGGARRARRDRHDRSTALIAALVTVLGALLVWQLNAMNQSIGELRAEMRAEFGELRAELRAEMRAEISGLRAEMQSEIGSLRTEMQAGFREVNATLLDHTERLTRLETWAGLTASDELTSTVE